MILNTEKQQLNDINSQATRRLSVVDFNYNGYSILEKEDTFVKMGYHAVKNKILYWLNCLLGDIPRSTYSSPLIALLGKTVIDETIIENLIRTSFEDSFSADRITLNDVKLKMNTAEIIIVIVSNILVLIFSLFALYFFYKDAWPDVPTLKHY